MNQKSEKMRELLTHQLQKDLIYFANRKNKLLSYSEAGDIASRMMKHVDIDHPAFKHKGTTWLARIIVDNLPAPPADEEKRNL